MRSYLEKNEGAGPEFKPQNQGKKKIIVAGEVWRARGRAVMDPWEHQRALWLKLGPAVIPLGTDFRGEVWEG
jgi:hypothetical protein